MIKKVLLAFVCSCFQHFTSGNSITNTLSQKKKSDFQILIMIWDKYKDFSNIMKSVNILKRRRLGYRYKRNTVCTWNQHHRYLQKSRLENLFKRRLLHRAYLIKRAASIAIRHLCMLPLVTDMSDSYFWRGDSKQSLIKHLRPPIWILQMSLSVCGRRSW